MDQRCGLQRLARLFACHLGGSKPPEFVIHERQQFFGGIEIAVYDRLQDAGDVGHEVLHTNKFQSDRSGQSPLTVVESHETAKLEF